MVARLAWSGRRSQNLQMDLGPACPLCQCWYRPSLGIGFGETSTFFVIKTGPYSLKTSLYLQVHKWLQAATYLLHSVLDLCMHWLAVARTWKLGLGSEQPSSPWRVSHRSVEAISQQTR